MKLKKITWIFMWFLGLNPCFAQTDDDSTHRLIEPAYNEILQERVSVAHLQVSIASKNKQSLVQAPAIVTVITEKEILHYGCRDIADILRLIPGFEFGIDVQGIIGVGFRGVWAHEGKALIMINNNPINCMGFGNNNFFGSVPSAMIDRVEVIRGPGSTLYGGFAEVAVVNIITKKGSQIRGAHITTQIGALSTQEWVRGGNISVGVNKDGLDVNFHIGTSSTPTSIRKYTDFAGNSFQMGNEASGRRWSHVVAELAYKDFYLTYTRSEQDFLGEDGLKFITPQTQQNLFVNRLAYRMETLRAHYEHWVGKEMKLKPSIEMSRGIPMATQNLSIGGLNTNTWSNMSIDLRRYQAELEWTYNPTDKDEISCGVGGQINTFYGLSTFGNPGIQTSANTADTTNFMTRGTVYGYAQYTRQREKIGFTTGIRTEQTPFGNATVPRIGITYVQKKLNAKLLYGRAFRTPMLYQAFSRSYTIGELVPETTNTFDLELGYKFDKYTYLRGNAFHTQIDKPITYLGTEEAYRNYGSVRTVGAEIEIKYQANNAQFFTNLAYAVPIKKFTNIDFMNQASTRFLALPTLKMNIGGSFTYQKMTIGSTATWLGTRHAQTQNSALNSTLSSTVIETQTYPAMLLVNLNLLFANVFHKHLSFRLTCQNLFNAPYTVLQPYYGGHAPLPVGDRQIETVVMLKF